MPRSLVAEFGRQTLIEWQFVLLFAYRVMNWTSWLIALLAWPAIGLVVAYLFGRFVRGVETPKDTERMAPPVVLYLRHTKRAKTSLSTRATPHTRSRRQTGGQRAR